MSRPTLAQDPAPLTFALFAEAHASVAETRDQLQVLAVLSQPESNTGDAPSDADAALAWCFSRLAPDLHAVVQTDAASPEGVRV